jgi:hypothetical protein
MPFPNPATILGTTPCRPDLTSLLPHVTLWVDKPQNFFLTILVEKSGGGDMKAMSDEA